MTQQALEKPVRDWTCTPDVSGSMRRWLTDTRLLTPDIRASLPDPVRVEVIRELDTRLDEEMRALLGVDSDAARLREINLSSGARLLVRAITLIPQQTADNHPWLVSLGARPLGDQLDRRADVRRGRMEFAPTATVAAAVGGRAGDRGWSRRSVIRIGGAPILLIEHLAPEFAQYERLHA